ncbi:MAG: hypothetical protein PHQ40_10195 [Anaerolineaceae bacterium]|nr:hypothetical protein [Anaerolineaceae bacterium]
MPSHFAAPRSRNGQITWLFCVISAVVALVFLRVSPANAAARGQELPPVVLTSGHTAGQTFVSKHAGLDGIAVYLAPAAAGEGEITLRLRASPSSPSDLATARLPVTQVDGDGYYSFALPPQSDSYLKSYYLQLELQGSGSLRLGTSSAETSLDGALYQDGQPVEAQLMFNQSYDRVQKVLGLLHQGTTWLFQLALGGLAFLLPGLALLLWLRPAGGSRLSAGEAAGLAGGISLALYPLLILWLDVVGLHPGALVPWVVIILSASYLGYRLVRGWAASHRPPRFQAVGLRTMFTGWMASPGFWPGLALVFVCALALFARLWAIRTLAAPLWGDAVQHTFMAQLIAEKGGLFTSWRPYAAFTGLTNQHGFSTNAAVWMWVSGQSATQAVLFFGQMANFLAVLALYPFVDRVTRGNRWAGVAAVAFAGIFSLLPGFYLNWGRYAQLAGQVILPASLWMAWEWLDHGKSSRGWLPLNALVLAGMLLCYYRMAFYYAGFLLVLFLFQMLPGWRKFARPKWSPLISWLGIGLAAGFLLLPWIIRVQGSTLAGRVEEGVTGGSPLQAALADYAAWGILPTYLPWAVVALCGLAWLFSLVRKQWLISGFLFWTALLAGVRAASLLHLPGANLMQSLAVVIFVYIPAAVLLGWFFGEGLRWLAANGRATGQVACLALVAGVSVLGLPGQLRIARPFVFSMVTWSDVRAMTWIEQNTPSDALFLVEAYNVYSNTAPVGTDAGWWLPLLAKRLNTLPPQYTLMSEQPEQPGYLQRVITLNTTLASSRPGSPEGLKVLCAWNVTHVYIGQQQGETGLDTQPEFKPADFEGDPAFRRVYAQDRVRIYALQPGACTH